MEMRMEMKASLCVGEYCETAYNIEELEIRVYCMEELCYCLKENAFLLDMSITVSYTHLYNPEATVLISTHLIEDVEQVLDEVIFMRYGQLVLYTSVDNIREEKGKSVDAYFREVFAC